MVRVAVDAMGGDHAPHEVIYGALAALEDEQGLEVLLVGDEGAIRAALQPAGPGAGAPLELPPRVHLHDAPERIVMDEQPVEAVRRKPGSSIVQGLRLCREGRADAFFSAGSTGAVVAAASMLLRRVEGVRRPGIAVVIPTSGGPTTLMDAGANLTPRPVDLVQYALMASAYARRVLGIAAPAVGLLNIGSEDRKGGPLMAEAAALCRRTEGLRYRGFVEGHEVFRGGIDVVVCDAFTGNAVLKMAEGCAESLLGRVRRALGAAFPAEGDRHRIEWALRELEQDVDYAEHGGAPLLGVEGAVVIGHGRSEAKAVASGIKAAARAAGAGLHRQLAAALAAAPSPG